MAENDQAPASCLRAELGGIVGQGWWPLLQELETELAAICGDNNWVVEQVKQKFGTLRYYALAPDGLELDQKSEFNQAIYRAEKRSATTCEECGQGGRLCSKSGAVRTLCCKCAAEQGYSSR